MKRFYLRVKQTAVSASSFDTRRDAGAFMDAHPGWRIVDDDGVNDGGVYVSPAECEIADVRAGDDRSPTEIERDEARTLLALMLPMIEAYEDGWGCEPYGDRFPSADRDLREALSNLPDDWREQIEKLQ